MGTELHLARATCHVHVHHTDIKYVSTSCTPSSKPSAISRQISRVIESGDAHDRGVKTSIINYAYTPQSSVGKNEIIAACLRTSPADCHTLHLSLPEINGRCTSETFGGKNSILVVAGQDQSHELFTFLLMAAQNFSGTLALYNIVVGLCSTRFLKDIVSRICNIYSPPSSRDTPHRQIVDKLSHRLTGSTSTTGLY